MKPAAGRASPGVESSYKVSKNHYPTRYMSLFPVLGLSPHPSRKLSTSASVESESIIRFTLKPHNLQSSIVIICMYV